jgi:tetratricopeptide (TPR) repeat protein
LRRPEALSLLAAVLGPDCVAAESHAANRLVDLVDGLPLALAIVAERAQRARSLADVVHALADERERLDALGTGEGDPHTDLRAAFSWSYRALGRDAAALLRKLGLHPAEAIGLDAAAALVERPLPATQQSLDELLAAHLVEQRRPHRYELHDLIRVYAAERALHEETADERDRAVRRILDWYLHGAVSADRHLSSHRRRDFTAPYEPQALTPRFAGPQEAMTWFEEEFENLRSMVGWAAANGWAGHAWRTAMAMTTFFDRRIPWQDGVVFYEAALRAAQDAGEDVGQGYTLNSLGCIHLDRGDGESARRCFGRALRHFQTVSHVRGEAMTLGNLGLVHTELGESDEGRQFSLRALELCTELGYPRGIALNLDSLGVAFVAVGEHERAIECYTQAQAIFRRLGDLGETALSLHHLGAAFAAAGAFRRSIRCYREAILTHRALDNRRWEAIVLVDLGKMLHRTGHARLARYSWETALLIMKEFADPRAEAVQADITALELAPVSAA